MSFATPAVEAEREGMEDAVPVRRPDAVGSAVVRATVDAVEAAVADAAGEAVAGAEASRST